MRKTFLCLAIISQVWCGVSAEQKEIIKDEEIQKFRNILEKALSIAEDIKQQEKRINIMEDIMQGFIKIGDIERTFDIVDRLYIRPTRPMLKQQVEKQEALEKKIRNEAFVFLTKEVSEIDIEKALLILEKIDDKNIKQQTFNIIKIKQVTIDPEKAVSVIEEIDDIKVKAQILSILAKKQAEKDFILGLKTAMKIDDTVIDIKIETVGSIINTVAETDTKKALELIGLIIDNYKCKQYAIGVVAIKEAKVNTDFALSLLYEVTEQKYKMQILKKIAEEVAEENLSKALSIADMIDDSDIKNQTLLNIFLKNIDKINKEMKK